MDQYEIINRTKDYLKYLGGIPDTIAAMQLEIQEKQELIDADPAARNERLQSGIDGLNRQIVDYQQEHDAFLEIVRRQRTSNGIRNQKGWDALIFIYFHRLSFRDTGKRFGGYSPASVRAWIRPVLLSVGSIMKGWRLDEPLYYGSDGTYTALTERQLKELKEIEAYNARLEAQGVKRLS